MSAELSWGGRYPFSPAVMAISYFSAEDGVCGSAACFSREMICRLPGGRSDFTIAETGLGLGLNFCATVQQWPKTRPRNGLLHYVSVEGFLECTRLLAGARALAGIGANRSTSPCALSELRGTHLIHFDEWGVILTLAIGEVGEMLSGLNGRVDAWFLDGFAPSRNPEMWREEVLADVARLTVSGGSLATSQRRDRSEKD